MRDVMLELKALRLHGMVGVRIPPIADTCSKLIADSVPSDRGRSR